MLPSRWYCSRAGTTTCARCVRVSYTDARYVGRTSSAVWKCSKMQRNTRPSAMHRHASFQFLRLQDDYDTMFII